MADKEDLIHLTISKSELDNLITITNHTNNLLKEDNNIGLIVKQNHIITKFHKQFKKQYPNKYLQEPTL